MNLSKLGRTNLTKGVSLLAVFALAGIGFSSFGSEVESDEMRTKTEFELEGLADPLFEELFQDKYHRALEAYKGSKGLFSCDDVCQVHKRRLSLVDRELSAIQDERAAARKAVLTRAREQRLSIMQATQEANLERRQFSHITSEERISVRRLARKAEKDAERAAAIAAYRAGLGIGDPLTLAEKQARAAAAKAARIAARESRKTPVEAAAEADARQAARWFDYLDEVAQAHGFANWEDVEQFMDHSPEERQAIREGNRNDGLLESRANVRAAARHATLRTPAPTPSPTPPPTVTPVCHLGRISGTFYHHNGRCNRLILNAPDGTSAAMSNLVSSCEASLAGGFNAQYPVGSTTVDNLGDVDNFHLSGGRNCASGPRASGVRASEVVLVQDANAAGVEMVMTRADSDTCQHIWTISYPSCSSLLESYGI